MMTDQERAQWQQEMDELLARAEEYGMWLYCSYQALWFSPEELREQQAKGSFRWGVQNFKLRHPKEHMGELRKEAESATTEYETFKAQITE